jgi:putative ABC transport system permease protein
LPEIDEVALVRMEQGFALAPNRVQYGVALFGMSPASERGGWTIIDGVDLAASPPSDMPPVVVTRRLASDLKLDPGSTLSIRARGEGRTALPFVRCRVVGIADFSFEASEDYTVATTMEGLGTVFGGPPEDIADLVLISSKPSVGADAAVAAIERLKPELHVYTNADMVELFNRNGFAYFRQISLVLSTTTVAFTFLLVVTLLTVSVNQRLGEIAALRALGISRRRVAGMLLWESALLVVSGGLLALPLGGALAGVLDQILRGMPGLPDALHFFVFSTQALVSHAVLLVVTAIVAALYPMWLAVHLPIAETLRREAVS